MPIIHLTKRSIEALPSTATGQVLYRDRDLTGFGLRVGRLSKVFFAESQVARRTVRVTIGKYGPLTPDSARRKALHLLGQMAEGINPNDLRRRPQSGALTVARAFEAFFMARSNLRPKTVETYRRSVQLYLAEWANRPIQEVSRQMVLRAHRRIADAHGAITANNVLRHFPVGLQLGRGYLR